jgi:hypothetical protein
LKKIENAGIAQSFPIPVLKARENKSATMRILVWQELFWPHLGGVEVLATKLLVALQQRGYEIVVVTRQDSLALPRETTYQGIPIHRYPFWAALRAANWTR